MNTQYKTTVHHATKPLHHYPTTKKYLAASSFHLSKVSESELLVQPMLHRVELWPCCHAVREARCNNIPAEFPQSRNIISKSLCHPDVLIIVIVGAV